MKIKTPVSTDRHGDIVDADGQTVLQLDGDAKHNPETLKAIADRLNLFDDMQHDLGVLLGAVDSTTDITGIALQRVRDTYNTSLEVSK